MSAADPPADVRFERLYRQHFDAIYAYAARRVGIASEVPDLVADVFTVAWRRIDDIPPPPHDLLWLYGVARRVHSQRARTYQRRMHLADRLARESATWEWEVPPLDANGRVSDRLAAALARLRPTDQELLRLVAWEALSRSEAAVVLGCSVNAVSIRWHRLMRRLARQLQSDASSPRRPVEDEARDKGAL